MKWIKTHRQFLTFAVAFVFLMGVCLFIPLLLLKFGYFGYSFRISDNLNDSLGGIIAPFVAIIAALITFMAFWVQYRANQKQWIEIKNDRKIYNYNNELTVVCEYLKLIRSNFVSGNIKDNGDVVQLLREVDELKTFFFDTKTKLYDDPIYPKGIYNIHLNLFCNFLILVKQESYNRTLNLQTSYLINLGPSYSQSLFHSINKIIERVELIRK